MHLRAKLLASTIAGSLVAAAFVACTTPYDAAPSEDAGSGSDAGSESGDAGTTDAGEDAPADVRPEARQGPCDVTKPFTQKTDLGFINSGAGEAMMRLSADELTGWFSSSRTGEYEIYETTRLTPASQFSLAKLVPIVNSTSLDANPTLTSDGKAIIFDSARDGARRLWTATRTSATGSFDTPVRLPGSSLSLEIQPFLSPTNDVLWFSKSNGQFDILYAPYSSMGVDVAADPGINDPVADDWAPVISHDGLTLYFASTRTGTKGGFDIWMARRSAKLLPFGTPTAVLELNTAINEYPGWLSADGCRLYYVTSSNGDDVWVASREP